MCTSHNNPLRVNALDERRFTDHLGFPSITRRKEDFDTLDNLALFKYSIE